MQPGSLLAHYEILSELGKGGMGEVWRARDTKLGRDVAVKVLPAEFSRDEERIARLEREARMLASLNHPNIAAIYGLEQSDDTRLLVLELVEGDTLADRLRRGAIPVEDALGLALQIAEALEAAHEKGVVHRDLKPANIKITPEGRVKVLDFGLAKAFTGEGADADPANSPTLSMAATREGVIMGTAAYMAPEQASGGPTDTRADIWAFGVVLFEMLTGGPVFEGETVSHVLAEVLKSSPDFGRLPAGLHPRIRILLERCLEKKAADRAHSIADARVDLERVLAAPESVVSRPEVRASRLHWATLAALVAIAVIAGGAWRLGVPDAAEARLTRLSVTLSDAAIWSEPSSPGKSLAISPDGRLIVYVGAGRRLYRRSLDRLEIEPLAGTEGAAQPFFSADGRSVGFFTVDGELKRVSLDGGPPATVTGVNNPQWAFGVWRADDTILFSTMEYLQEVPATGGEPRAVTAVDEAGGEEFHHLPQVVPSTGDILFVAEYLDRPATLELIDREGGGRITLLEGVTAATLTASSHLLFIRDGVLMAAAFDGADRRVGAPVPLSESVVLDSARFATLQLAVGDDGTLAYVPSDPRAGERTLGWLSRSGEFTEVGTLPSGSGSVALSPDGTRALLDGEFGGDEVFLFDLERRISTGLNLGDRETESTSWHPDGRITLGGPYVSVFDPDTGTETLPLTPAGRPKRNPSWTPDGGSFVYDTFDPENNVHMVRLDPEPSQPLPFLSGTSRRTGSALSPGGEWIAYVSNESGSFELYVSRFPAGTGTLQITSGGAGAPVWSRDGRELFFFGPGGLNVVPITLGDRVQAGTARALFPRRDSSGTALYESFDVSAEGDRFLVVRAPVPEPTTEIIIVQNWLAELERLVPSLTE